MIHWLIAFGPPVEGDQPPFDGGHGSMAPSSAGIGSGIFVGLVLTYWSNLARHGIAQANFDFAHLACRKN